MYEGEKDELTWTDPADDAKRKFELGLDLCSSMDVTPTTQRETDIIWLAKT